MKKYLLALILLSTHLQAADVIAEFKRPLSGAHQSIIRQYGLNVGLLDSYPNDYFSRTYKIQGSEAALERMRQDQALQAELIRLESINSIDPMSLHVTSGTERLLSDPFSTYQWGLHNQGQYLLLDQTDIRSQRLDSVSGKDIGLKQSLPNIRQHELSSITVAVLDSGVDYEHADLRQQMVQTAGECDELGKPPFRATSDQDGNGYTGDCLGWDFTAAGNGNNRPLDDQGHGTHVAGIVAAQWNQQFVAGVAPNAKILAVKVLKKQEQAAGGQAFSDRVAKGILYAVRKGAHVINLSLGWPAALDTQYLRQAFAAADAAGVLVVAAAGNNASSRALYPCNYASVICVGATTITGELASFSNYGAHVDVLAPGEQIISTFPTRMMPSYFSINGMEIKNGTSQASPFVAGMLAVLKGASPGAGKRQLLQQLLLHTQDRPSTGNSSAYGLVNLKSLDQSSQAALLRPLFKDNQFITVNAAGEFTTLLTLQNLSTRDLEAIMTAQVEGQHVSLQQEQFAVSVSADSDQQLEIKGRVESLQISQDLRLCYQLKVEENLRTYCQDYILARIPDFDSEAHAFALPPQVAQQMMLPNAVLKSVYDPQRALSGPVYYWEGRQGNDLSVGLWTPKADGETSPSATFVLPNAQRIISLISLDANGDGVNDLVAMALAQRTTSSGAVERYLQFSYFSQDGRELYAGRTHFSYVPELVVPELNETLWHTQMFAHGKMAVPVFMANGGTPARDKNPDPFLSNDRDQTMPHLYALLPDGVSQTLTLRLLDNYKMRGHINEKLSLKWYEDISLLGPVKQSKAMQQQSQSHILLSVGQAAKRRTVVWSLGVLSASQTQSPAVQLASHRWQEIAALNNSGAMDGSFRIPVTELSATEVVYQASTALVGMHTDTLSRYLNLNVHPDGIQVSAQGHYRHALERDHLIGALPAFKTVSGEMIYLYQSKAQILVVYQGEKQGDKQRVFSRPIHRSSFLPGKVFNEMFYPITMGSQADGSVVPGLYIDSSQLFQGSVSAMRLTAQGPEFLLSHSLQLPAHCRAMNPARFEGREGFSILCQIGRSYKLYLLAF